MLTSLSRNWLKGFIKIYAVDKTTGEAQLLVDKSNLVLYSAGEVIVSALGGKPNSGITHMYVAYANANDNTFAKPVIDQAYTHKFSDYGTSPWEDYGYLRLPLASPPILSTNNVNYISNTVTYSVVVSTDTAAGGAAFQSTPPVSRLFEVALVNAANPTSGSEDRIFSRAQFNPIEYSQNSNLNIVWGIRVEL